MALIAWKRLPWKLNFVKATSKQILSFALVTSKECHSAWQITKEVYNVSPLNEAGGLIGLYMDWNSLPKHG